MVGNNFLFLRRYYFTLLILTFTTAALALSSTVGDGVIVRDGPGEKYGFRMDLPQYYPLRVLKTEKGWCKVSDWLYNQGWVTAESLSKVRTAIVRRSRVNLRSGPGTGYRRIKKLYKGSILKIIKRYYNWYKVEVVDPPDGGTGWIYRSLIWG